MAATRQRNIDWASAEIEDAALTVQLTGASTKAWKQRFESVLALLDSPHSRWGEVHLNRKAVQVADVQPGAEMELRHCLESIVVQVSSELREPGAPAQDAEQETSLDEAAQADRRMTAAFRAFAQG
jgi:hypothetical protein